MESKIQLHVETLSTYALAAQQNAYPLFRALKLEYIQKEDGKNGNNESAPLQKLKLQLRAVDGWLEGKTWLIDFIAPGQLISLPRKKLSLPFEKLYELSEELTICLDFRLFSESGEKLAECKRDVTLLPSNYWGGESRQPELLAAFVRPNGLYVESLLRDVAKTLEQSGHGRSIDGYQSNTREKPYLMLAALWNVIFSQEIAYVTPPVGFAKQGQRIRLASDISSSRIAACLDTSLLFASCIEAMGLNPVVALTNTHAFAGAWLIDDRLPMLSNDDPMDIRKRVDMRDIVLFETTLVTSDSPVNFEQAKDHARRLLSEELEEDFVLVLDIAQARAQQIKPLASVEAKREELFVQGLSKLELPAVPPLPPVRADERVIEETPETRIDSWCRKLLDLSKRNSLLNLRERAVSIKLFCPDIAAMEDKLANDDSFTFISAEDSPVNNEARDSESFQMQHGSDMHRDYALEQLKEGVLVANLSTKKLERHCVSLFRKAKYDLEESGSNTLYLALGMLKWKENPHDERSFRAPLILIPVTLQRKSARAAVTLQQRSEEEVIFNLTLIEFLQTEHGINLSEFKKELPLDKYGIDVPEVWERVREAVSEHRGFEVVEECVLASFSFAKYLMWKDLRERLDDLKENAFVRHLVDTPQEVYEQNTSFIPREKLDESVDPSEVLTPLYCDSSQLVAVEASSKAQDFVLEGPPGTGKSETIANIIAHNIGQGRKVLFVAEKMAALNVVYRRMQKVGLDHLCLELHSNKIKKRTVLDQLERAVQKRKGLSRDEWVQQVEALKHQRNELNAYVAALHKKSQYGLSPREAISGCVNKALSGSTNKALSGSTNKALSESKNKDVNGIVNNSHDFTLTLDWSLNLENAPIQNENAFKACKAQIKRIAAAYQDVRNIDKQSLESIHADDWSNAWQAKLIKKLTLFSASLPELHKEASRCINQFSFKKEEISPGYLRALESLFEIVETAANHSIDYCLTKGSKDRLKRLEDISQKKQALDDILLELDSSITAERLADVPMERWLQQAEKANNGWFSALMSRWRINSDAKKLGITKFKDLSTVQQIKDAYDIRSEIKAHTRELESFNLWQGWSTSPDLLNQAFIRGKKIRASLTNAMQLVDEPQQLISLLKKHVVDGRDYIEESKLYRAGVAFTVKYAQFVSQIEELKLMGYSPPLSSSLKSISQHISGIEKNQAKLKIWCEWLRAKKLASGLKIESLTDALAEDKIRPKEAESQFIAAYCRWLAPLLIDAEPLLREFKSSSHELSIERFQELDEKVAELSSEYIIALTAAELPEQESKTHDSAMGILAKEIQKKSRHLPIRTLIEKLGRSLLSLSPCLMMSPLSVAQFLPASFRDFDLVVFDEASQMTTWDSVGAIARGKNVIVVGDPKQMPPTNFFSALASNEDPEEEDLESILDQALAARLPQRRLMGHYRSRHETLIAFSNKKYYDNELVTYPSADTKESAITLHRVPGIYARGKGRNNLIEAQAVVDEIVRRLTTPGEKHKSIGVVSLNTDQQRTIEDLLDEARRKHPDIEPYFHSKEDYDSVFVKNLESVQGDERDVIILSLAYGPNELGAKTMSMNFGPLNKSGGERRLNVAITRATTEVLIFSSFDSAMIDLSRSSATAVEHLKHYLEFAERGPRSLGEHPNGQNNASNINKLEQVVAQALQNKGWKVKEQVGVSKFALDLGIYHPDKPGVFLAGIECDGLSYRDSPSARDRDRIRPMVLNRLGWRILRLWATDYFIDPESAIEKIDTQLSELVKNDREKQLAETNSALEEAL